VWWGLFKPRILQPFARVWNGLNHPSEPSRTPSDTANSTAAQIGAVIRIYDEAGRVIETHQHLAILRRLSERCGPSRGALKVTADCELQLCDLRSSQFFEIVALAIR
jgi:hypothetical protein